jgi:hypothetical protein
MDDKIGKRNKRTDSRFKQISRKQQNKSKRVKNKIEKLKKKYRKHAKYENESQEAAEIQNTIKLKLVGKAAKVRADTKSHQRKTDDRMFQNSEKRFYQSIRGGTETDEIPTKEEVTEYWTGLWSEKVEHKKEAYWREKIERKYGTYARCTYK